MEISLLQQYWWLIISVLGAILVFLLFVQGGQTMLTCQRHNPLFVNLMADSLGHKWELTFTTLVVFGGAFFASFPLFYSTSFGGAYWLWMLILFSFILQAVSYEFRTKPGNLFGTKVYDIFLTINGVVGCVLLGVAVASFFNLNDFSVVKGNILDGSSPVISQWGHAHGFDVIFNCFNLLLGIAVLFLARTQAALYFMNNIAGDDAFFAKMKKSVLVNGLIFAVLFVAWIVWLLLKDGYETTGLNSFDVVSFKYFKNYVDLWWTIPMFLLGVVLVLFAIFQSVFAKHFTKGVWFSGIGTVLVVLTLFWVAGYNNTPYYPSLDATSSLTIQNSSSTEFTLTVMSYVSILVPFVLAYIVYAWYCMDRKKTTPDSLGGY